MDGKSLLLLWLLLRTQDVTLKTCRRRWMIGRSGERWSGISVLAARHDDDDDDDIFDCPGCICYYIYNISINVLLIVFVDNITGLMVVFLFLYYHLFWLFMLNYRAIGLMSRVFANGPGDRGSIPGRVAPKTKKNGTWCHFA